MITFYLSGLFLGLGSSLHCAGMCGPLVLSMPFSDRHGRPSINNVVLYHMGKTISYTILGALFGIFGMGLKIAGSQQFFSIGFGLLILILVIGPKINNTINNYLRKIENRWSHAMIRLSNAARGRTLLILGLSNGFIPCGIIYIALAASVMTYNALDGAIFMALFGIGTIPILSFIILGQKMIREKIKFKMPNISMWLSIILASLFILRGLGLNIPYISPAINKDQKLECCKHK